MKPTASHPYLSTSLLDAARLACQRRQSWWQFAAEYQGAIFLVERGATDAERRSFRRELRAIVEGDGDRPRLSAIHRLAQGDSGQTSVVGQTPEPTR
jgi:hypothetical protein